MVLDVDIDEKESDQSIRQEEKNSAAVDVVIEKNLSKALFGEHAAQHPDYFKQNIHDYVQPVISNQ